MMSLTPDRLARGIEQEQNKIEEGAKPNKTKTKFVPDRRGTFATRSNVYCATLSKEAMAAAASPGR